MDRKHRPRGSWWFLIVLLILAGMGWNMWTHPDWAHGSWGEATNSAVGVQQNNRVKLDSVGIEQV